MKKKLTKKQLKRLQKELAHLKKTKDFDESEVTKLEGQIKDLIEKLSGQ